MLSCSAGGVARPGVSFHGRLQREADAFLIAFGQQCCRHVDPLRRLTDRLGDRGETTHHALPPNLRDDAAQRSIGVAAPVGEQPALGFGLVPDAEQAEECGVGHADPSARIGDDDGIVGAAGRCRRAGIDRVGAGVLQGAHANQDAHRVLGSERRRRDAGAADRSEQTSADLAALSAGACRGEQCVDGATRGVRERRGGDLADEGIADAREQPDRGRVGIEDLEAFRIDDDHAVGGHLEQHLVLRLRLACVPVAALHVLLRFDETLLNGGDRSHVAADRQHRTVFAEADRRVGNRQIDAGRQRMIDLAPARHALAGRFLQELLDLAARFAADRVDPWLADPRRGRRRDRLGVALLHGANDAAAIDDERDVARQGDEGLGELGRPGRQLAEIGWIAGDGSHVGRLGNAQGMGWKFPGVAPAATRPRILWGPLRVCIALRRTGV